MTRRTRCSTGIRRLAGAVLLLAASTLGSCHPLVTKIAIVDPHYGFERARNGASISLQGRRSRVDWVEDGELGPETGALVFTLGDCSTGPLKRLGFTLSFLAENESDHSFQIVRGMFALHNESSHFPDTAVPVAQWQVAPRSAARKDEVLITVPAGTSAVFDVPIQVVCPTELSEKDALRTRFHLSITAADGHDFLHRQIDTGRWSQLGQGLRAVGAFTLALVLIAAL